MHVFAKRTIGIAAGLLMAAGALTACSPAAEGDTGDTADAATAKIGLLLPEVTTLRYEEKDKPYFTEALRELCPDCELLYANASSDAAKQL